MSVVIPAVDAEATLSAQLEALATQTYSGWWEVVVVDNGSRDGTAEVARSWVGRFPTSLRVVEAADRPGVNYARNVGARCAMGDFLLFCDADDVVAPGWVEAMARAAASCDAVGGHLEEASLNDERTRQWRTPATPGALPVGLGFLPFPYGANCGVRREVFERIGGFDESYSRGGDEVDFFWRAQLAGARLCYVPDAVVRYRHRSGLGPLVRQWYRYGFTSVQLFAHYRARGIPPERPRDIVRSWGSLFYHVADLVGPPGRRGNWLRVAAHRFGQLAGSIRYRTIHLA